MEHEDTEVEIERQELSWFRVGLLIIMLAAIAGAGYVGAQRVLSHEGAKANPWFAPYVDATLAPYYQFQDPTQTVTPDVVLGFVVDSNTAKCAPSWGGNYTLPQAAVTLNLDRRIVQLRSTGGNATVSFGGGGGTDLAVSCHTVSSLASAYEQVIERYGLRTIDLDDEQANALTPPVMARRAAAIAEVQSTFARHGVAIKVWLSLPAGPRGIGSPGLRDVSAMLHAHVKVAGVNSLDLDFGDNRYPVTEMLPAVESSLRIAHGQLAAIFGRNRVGLSSQELWGRMGSTVQIGQNAVNKEAFGIYDAEQFVVFAKDVGLGRVSMWSLNRDSQCGTDFPVLGELSNTCSGVAQGNLQFSSIFASLHGHTPALSVPTSAAPTASPNNYPFPLWQADEAYNGGYLVVWQGDVYVAKYFTQGVAPDTPTSYTYQDPWELLGPVLTSDSAPTTTTLPAGTYPKWTATASYPQGARVLYEGLPFVAKYYTVGSSPGAVDVDPQYSPWQPLYTVPNEP